MSKVKLIAVSKAYRSIPYFAVPVYDEEAKVWRPTADDVAAVYGKKVSFTPDPEKQYPISHHMPLDKNNKDDAILLAVALAQPNIAKSKKEVISTKHLFYVEDLEAEAVDEIQEGDKYFEAMSKVKENASVATMRDLAIYLGFDPSMSMKVLQGRVYAHAKTDPESVLKFFTPDSQSRLFVKKVIHYGVLLNKGGIFYDGDRLIGRDEAEVELFVNDSKNAPLVAKWTQAIEKIEGVATPGKDPNKIPLKRKTVNAK